MLRIAMLGATGRMGTAIIRLIAASSDLRLSGASAAAGDAGIGRDAGLVAGIPALGVTVGDSPLTAVTDCDVAIDFTAAAALDAHLAACATRGCGLVLGTTAIGEAGEAKLREAARTLAIVYARNMSVGVQVLAEAARIVTRLIGAEADIEITEAHHRHKTDAPSGTALQLGEVIAETRGRRLGEMAVFERHGTPGARQPGSIGFSSVRAGNIIGDHEILFALEDELIRLEHRALDRTIFARGALRAAHWLPGRSPGIYGMAEVLGLTGASRT